MLNKITLIGRLGKNPESKKLESGNTVCNFSIATDEHYTDKAGVKQTDTEWFDVVMWNELGEIAAKYLKQGGLVYIEGKMETDEWTDKETGQKRSKMKVKGQVLKMLGTKDKSSDSPTSSGETTTKDEPTDGTPF